MARPRTAIVFAALLASVLSCTSEPPSPQAGSSTPSKPSASSTEGRSSSPSSTGTPTGDPTTEPDGFAAGPVGVDPPPRHRVLAAHSVVRGWNGGFIVLTETWRDDSSRGVYATIHSYTRSGATDPAFNGGEPVSFRFAWRDDGGLGWLTGRIVDDGSLVIAAEEIEARGIRLYARRLRRDGTIDKSFTERQRGPFFAADVDETSEGVILSDGRVRVCLDVGPLDDSVALFGLTSRGARDEDLGPNGLRRDVVTGTDLCSWVTAADGRLTMWTGDDQDELVRATYDGRLDRSFGGDGRVPFPQEEGWQACDVRWTSERLYAQVTSTSDDRVTFGVMGITQDGEVDRGFGEDGIARVGSLPLGERRGALTTCSSIDVPTADDVFLSGYVYSSGGNQGTAGPGTVWKLDTDEAALDPSFGDGGALSFDRRRGVRVREHPSGGWVVLHEPIAFNRRDERLDGPILMTLVR